MSASHHLSHAIFTIFLLLAMLPARLCALVPVTEANLSQPTGIAPLYFGPNAFPVPDMLRGEVDGLLSASLYADGYWGFDRNRTADLGFHLSLPLFTRWASLQVWMPIQEWYDVPSSGTSGASVGHGAGDAYVATHIQLLSRRFPAFSSVRGAAWIPGVSLRVALKSASGGQYALRRHYDTPGYWFDAAIDQPLLPSGPVSLMLTATAGFLCWQTDNGRQNDAIQYGVGLLLDAPYLSASAQLVGYSGWEHYGDRPMVVRVRLASCIKGFEPFVQYQYGLRDYPFHQLRLGLTYHLDVLSLRHRSADGAAAAGL